MDSNGGMITDWGFGAVVGWGTMCAMGAAPSSFALRADVTTLAAAPSFMLDALPAVTVPSFLQTGFRLRSASADVSSRGPSSLSNKVGASLFFFAGFSTRTIWLLQL